MISLIGMQYTGTWTSVMWSFVNAVKPGMQPIWYNNLTYLWFANVLMTFVALLLLNLFVVIVI